MEMGEMSIADSAEEIRGGLAQFMRKQVQTTFLGLYKQIFIPIEMTNFRRG